MKRRHLLHAGLAVGVSPALLAHSVFAQTAASKAQVIVIGGGYGGATAAKYIRVLSNYNIPVLLIEPQSDFISCPMSNLVLGGSKNLKDITTSYDALTQKHGVKVIRDRVIRIDPETQRVIVGPRAALAVQAARIIDANWLTAIGNRPVMAKVRSMSRPVAARLDGEWLRFDVPEYGVAPGQAAVLYDGDRVLGGGWIEETVAVELALAG
jgi:NADPH-dependent 2,4-dienoyl-CoA reductase/sulfur reductase-like enzyme